MKHNKSLSTTIIPLSSMDVGEFSCYATNSELDGKCKTFVAYTWL